MIVFLMAVVAGSVALAANALLHVEPRYNVSAQLVVPNEQAEAVAKMMAADDRGQGVRAERRDLDPQAASLIFSVDTTHQQGRDLNELGGFVVEKLTAVPRSPPKVKPKRNRCGTLAE